MLWIENWYLPLKSLLLIMYSLFPTGKSLGSTHSFWYGSRFTSSIHPSYKWGLRHLRNYFIFSCHCLQVCLLIISFSWEKKLCSLSVKNSSSNWLGLTSPLPCSDAIITSSVMLGSIISIKSKIESKGIGYQFVNVPNKIGFSESSIFGCNKRKSSII